MFLAARGARATTSGIEKIEDSELAQGLVRKSKTIHRRAVLAALVLTAVLLAAGYLVQRGWYLLP